jgi:hypothetical protein
VIWLALAPLVMKQVDATSLHMANNAGAENWRDDITIAVDLGDKGKVTASSTGTRRESDLDASSTANRLTVDETKWTTTWSGTWSRDQDKLVLELTRASDTCASTRTLDDYAPEKRTCAAAAKHAKVTCTSAQVTVDNDDKPPRTVDAWSCSPADADSLGETVSGWTLGKTECLQRMGGHMHSYSYAVCAKL